MTAESLIKKQIWIKWALLCS